MDGPNSIIDFIFPKEEELDTEEDVTYIVPEEPIRKLHRILREKVTFKQRSITANKCYQRGVGDVPTHSRRFTTMTCGSSFEHYLTQNGAVYCMGENMYGALGIGSEDYDHVEVFPTRVPLKTRCVQIASNSTFHVLALLSNGKLFGWGVNDGQLGSINEETPTNLPVEIELPFRERIRSIYAGGNGHKGVSYLITEMGRIFAMGNNEFGQLGLGDKETRYQPTMLKRWATITSLSIGGHHVLALSDEERVYACGHNLYKQLGTQANMDNFYFGEVKDLRDEGVIQVCAGGFFSAALSRNGSVFLWGRSQECQCALSDNIVETPYRLKSLTRVVDIAVGWCHVIAHTDEGKTYEWGALKDGDQFTYQMVTQVPDAPKNIVKLYCGLYSSFALYN